MAQLVAEQRPPAGLFAADKDGVSQCKAQGVLAQEAHLAESAEGLKAALNEVAEELKLAYDQIRNAV